MKNIISLITAIIVFPIISFGQSEYNKTVYFANNSTKLEQASLKSIDSLILICSSAAEYTFTLVGHTDDVGSNEFNAELSSRRVSTVLDYLTSKNVLVDKIKKESLGETKPKTSNASENNRALNRRVELTLKIRKAEPTVVSSKNSINNVDSLGWPGEYAILVSPGTRYYSVPGTIGGQVEISVITTTAEMEAGNFTTYTTDGIALTSNLVFCIGRIVGADCDLAIPIKIYIPAGANPYCKVPDVKFYDAEKDSIGNGSIKWKEISPLFENENFRGQDYFVMTIRSLCRNACKNYDCPKLNTAKALIKLNARKLKLSRVDVIHETANALLPGKEISKNYWKIEYFDFAGLPTPTIKLTYSKKRKKKIYVKKFKLTDFEKDFEGNYVVTKEQVKVD